KLWRKGVPPASSDVIRTRMINTNRRDTKPELELRSALHRMGYRFRVDVPINGSRRKSDVVFAADRVVVYVDGCFWHGCREHGTIPKQNREWWTDKLEANRTRDADTNGKLVADGWTVLRFWEHEDPQESAAIVSDAILAARRSVPPTVRAGR
ncbi:MAG: very short patch repair endonuclease, partial [Gaiellaceae bacterium]